MRRRCDTEKQSGRPLGGEEACPRARQSHLFVSTLALGGMRNHSEGNLSLGEEQPLGRPQNTTPAYTPNAATFSLNQNLYGLSAAPGTLVVSKALPVNS